MSTFIASEPALVPGSQRWLRIARASAFCSLSLFLLLAVVAAFAEGPGDGVRNLVPVVVATPLWLPYVWMLLQMNAKNAQTRKKGLALAIAYGAWALLLAALSALASWGWALQGSFALFALLQVLLMASSIQTYRAAGQDPGDKRILRNRILVVSVCLSILCLSAMVIPCMVTSKLAADEASSVAAMRRIYSAQSIYAEKHPSGGFAATLAELGPAPGAALIDQQLASGIKSGYHFSMIPAPQNATGRITQYTVLARPLTYQASGLRSFFVDASGVIRATAADRAPTAQDPPL